MHMYADGTQLCLSFDPKEYRDAVRRVETCLSDIKQWMIDCHLKLNGDKTDVMLIGGKSNITNLQKGTQSISVDEGHVEIKIWCCY